MNPYLAVAPLVFFLCLVMACQQSYAQVLGGPMMPRGPILQSPSLRDHSMASSGDSVYLVYTVQMPDGGMSLYFEKSTDAGRTFGSPVLLANGTGIGRPFVAASDDNVYVAWDLQQKPQDLLVRRSANGGTTFQSTMPISTGNSSQFTINALTSNAKNVNLVWTGFLGPNRTSSVMLSQSTDSGGTFGEPVLLSDPSLQSSEQAVAQSNSTTYVAWSSRQNCADPMGHCTSMIFLLPIDNGRLGNPVHLESLDGLFPIEIAANADKIIVEGLKRSYDNTIFENSTIVMEQSRDGGVAFSPNSSTYDVYMAEIFPVMTDRTLYQFWTVYELGLEPQPIYVERSFDGGITFDTPQKVSGATTPLSVRLGPQTAPDGDSAYVAWYGESIDGSYHVYLDRVTPDSSGSVMTIEDLYQAGGFQFLQGSSGRYVSFGAGQNVFLEPVDDTSNTEKSLLCPFVQDTNGSVILDRPQAMVDGMATGSVLAGWNVAASAEMHEMHSQSSRVIYQIQAVKDGNITFQSRENYTVTCGYSPNNVIDWSPQTAGNYTVVVSLLNPDNLDVISSENQTVQVSENRYLGNSSSTSPVQFEIVNGSSSVDQGGWAKFTVRAGPGSPNYRLHNIGLWIDAPKGIEAWFDKYSIFSYGYKLDNLTMWVYVGSAASPGTNTLKIEGKGVVANLLNGTIFDVGNPMPPAGNQNLENIALAEHENGQQVGALGITINPSGGQSPYMVIGQPNLHPFTFCSKEPMVHGMGGGTSCSGFIGYDDFPVTVYSNVTQTVNLGATNLPNGTWFKYLPQQVVATPQGTPSRLVMAGAEEPFEVNVLDVKVGRFYANTTQGSSVAYLPLIRNMKVDVINGTGPIEFGSVNANINSTTPSSFGMVYNSTSGSLPVSLQVLGILQNNTSIPVPPWLGVRMVPSSFVLNYSQPYYIKLETSTKAPPSGAHVTVLVGEEVGGRKYTGHIDVSVPPAVYFASGTAPRLAPITGGGPDNIVQSHMPSVPIHPIPPASIWPSKCKAPFVSVIKAEDGRLACVRPVTAKILEERGWAENNNGSLRSVASPRHPPDGFGCGYWTKEKGWVKTTCVSPNLPHP